MRSRQILVSVLVASCATTTPPIERYRGVTTCGREPVTSREHEPRPDQRVRDAIERRARSFEACFSRSAEVATRFTIDEDGTVAGVEVHGTIAEIDRCVCDRLAATPFPKLDVRTTVTYPFVAL
jgi:hypothetical protein